MNIKKKGIVVSLLLAAAFAAAAQPANSSYTEGAFHEDTWFVGGGLGLTPLYYLAKSLPAPPRVLLGFGTRADAVYLDEFRALGAELTVCTADGSLGEKGLVTDLLPRFENSFFYACGPLPMAEALCRVAPGPGQLSLEARMGCGFGACMGCTIETTGGPRRVCKDGPVFEKEALVWQTRA